MVSQDKTSEMKMEEQIETDLVNINGYVSRNNRSYDKKLCMDPELVINFILATQPEEWEKLKLQHGAEIEKKFLKRLSNEIERRGTLDVIRKGVTDLGVTFDLFYPIPVSKMNETYQKKFQANTFSVMRQVYFSEKNNKSIDMAVFINGLPIITMELKDKVSGSSYSVDSAIIQYKKDRDPTEPFLRFKRCLVHFALDEDLVYMTTKLEKYNTKFLPFNKGRDYGAGNPDTAGYRTEYLWKEIFAPDIISDLLRNFLIIEKKKDDNKKIQEKLIFPRYHQLDAVRKLTTTTRNDGPGKNYLIEHSAGSGKSNTIAWLSYKLTSLHDENDKKVFNSIIVITDRIVLDQQLQRTIYQFSPTAGVVEKIEHGSNHLKRALESGKKIIVTTIQKFPYIVDDVKGLQGKSFAVIIDEAHSSQTGETSKALKKVLKFSSLKEAEENDVEDEYWEDELIKEMESRGRPSNVSFFAFTATPKNKTLEMFGEKQVDEKYKPFHLYSMKQAIEEKFILDVLKNYTTCKGFFNLLKTIEDDPKYERDKASALLKAYVEIHEHAVQKKVAIIIEHLKEHVLSKIPDNEGNGQAKAMIVTRSRLHAIRYKFAVDKYLKEKGYDEIKALVAFSGTVKDRGMEYTEYKMNGFPESQTAAAFDEPENKILIVANKFQTGFDQPLLYAMYVDKRLSGVAAVQTLSRLNRIHSNKEEPIIIDFANDSDQIAKSFEKYYITTELVEGTDPNNLYDFKHTLESANVFFKEDVDEFAVVFFDKNSDQDKLHPIINRVVERFKEIEEQDPNDFRKNIQDYLRLYSFISQVMTFSDPELEKLYAFLRILIRKLPFDKPTLPREVLDQVDINALKYIITSDGLIELKGSNGELNPSKYKHLTDPESPEFELLSKIVNELNERYGTDFSEKDIRVALDLQYRIQENDSLIKSVKVNPKDKVKITFNQVFEKELQNIFDENFNFYKKVNDDKRAKQNMIMDMFEAIYQNLVKSEG